MKNKDYFYDHVAYLGAREANPRTVLKHLFCLQYLTHGLGSTDAKKATKEEIMGTLALVNSSSLSARTKSGIDVVKKAFYKHLMSEDVAYPHVVA